jgi:hypothetical protein
MEKEGKVHFGYLIYEDGNILDVKKNIAVNNSVNKSGYVIVNLVQDGKRKLNLLHRVIAQAFLPNPSNKKCVNHINGIKVDNRVENLEWVTYSENMVHAFKKGLNSLSEKQKNNLKAKIVKKVIDKSTGITYNSIIEACNELGLKYTQTKTHLSRNNEHLTILKYI